MDTTLTLTPIERGALMALVGLAVSVMKNDRETGQEFAALLSSPEMEGVCFALIDRLNGDNSEFKSLLT
jgi:hypothetical protein